MGKPPTIFGRWLSNWVVPLKTLPATIMARWEVVATLEQVSHYVKQIDNIRPHSLASAGGVGLIWATLRCTSLKQVCHQSSPL